MKTIVRMNWACCTRCNEKRHDRVGSLELGTSDRT